MFEVLTGLFDTTGFPPRKACGTAWTPPLIWLHVVSDLFIWLAYLSIPLVLLYFTRRRELPFPRLFILFALFILACGTTHLIDALIFEYPVYRLAGVMKFLTAVVSWTTVIALVPVVPRVMSAMSAAAQPGAATRQHRALAEADRDLPSRTHAYIVALLAGVLAVLVRAAIDPLVKDDNVFVLALLAVVYVSWQHGFGPGLLCLCVGVACYTFFFVPPRRVLFGAELGSRLAVALFFFCGVACAALGESQRQAARRARVALSTAVEWGKELEAEVARRRAAEAELVAAQKQTAEVLARLDAFLDNAPLGIAFFDPDLRYVRINSYLAAANGHPVEAHAGRTLPEMVPDFPPDVAAEYRRTAGPNGVPFTAQIRRPARDGGGPGTWKVSAFPVRAPGGAALGAGVIARDVTAEVKAQEELRDSEARFRTLAQAVPHIIWVTRPDGYHEYYNDRWYEYTGLTPEQSIGHGWSGPLHPDDKARAEARWGLATGTGEEYEIEYRFRGADGRYRWFLGRALPQRGADGGIVRWYGTCTDIHDEKTAAEAVRRSEERYRVLTEAVPNVVWNADADGEMTYFNRRWLDLTAVPLERARGRGWLVAVHPDDRDRVFAAWTGTVARARPGPGDRFATEFRLREDRTGEYRWFQTVAAPLRHSDGRVDQWIGSMADIHDQKTAADAIRESEERFRNMADSVPALVWLAEPDGRRTYFNKTWLKFTGRGAEEQFGSGWVESVHPDDRERYLRAYAAAIAERRPFELEYRLRRHDGADRWAMARGTPRFTPSGEFAGFVGLCLDVTERREAEVRLRESEAFRKSVFENSPDCLKIVDLDGRVLEMNEGGRRLMEIDDFCAVRGEQWGDLWPPADRDTIGEVIGAARAGRPARFQGFCPTAKGTGKYWDVSVSAIPSADGTPYRLIAVSRDVTEQRRAEQRVRDSEEMLRQLADSMPQIVFAARTDGTVDYFNRRWYEYTGFPQDGTVGDESWVGVHEPDQLERVSERWLRSVRTGEPYQIEYRLRRHDGAWRWHLGRALPVRDAGGDIIRWYGTNTDVHDAKLAAEALRVSEERFRTLTEAVPQMVWTADPRGEVTFFNRRWGAYTGLPLEAGRATWAHDPIHPDDADRVRAGWQLAVAQGAESYSSEFRLRRAADGGYQWMLSAAVPLRGPNGDITEWVGSLTDIDDQKRQAHTLERMVRERTAELEATNVALTAEVRERKAVEEQVRAVAAELVRSNGELEKFAYVASHDLQEPLRKIQAFGDRLRTKCRDLLPDAGKEYVDRMLVAAGRMRRLIDDLLTFSRVSTQKRPFVRPDLGNLVREVVSDLDVRITQAGATVNVGPLPVLDADATQMRQLFQNLIANAVKFHRPGVPPVVEIGSEPVALAPAADSSAPLPGFRITVRDNGIGFDDKYRERIFDVFQRLHGRDEYEGTGVGLAICRKIAERHGGTITAHAKVGEGATFIVTLPATQSNTREATGDDV